MSAGVHALTAGAIGTMTLGMMTRVSRGHTGRELTADGITSLIYVAINLAAATRLAAAFDSDLAAPAADGIRRAVDFGVSSLCVLLWPHADGASPDVARVNPPTPIVGGFGLRPTRLTTAG